ncbi:MAG TPA: polysaccharide deacetylase family protein [Gemmatimonadales bacterium]|jgi:peptidoglycan/xylan/chitin deacetylase (PgdA/CDA1 family)
MRITALLKGLAGRLAPSLVLVRGSPASGAVALTFDDGPHLTNTPLILDVLARFGVPATFFVQGTSASRTPDLLRDIAARGHVVGNHGFQHLHWRRQPTAELVRDVEATQALIQASVGRPQPRLYRPPYGEITARAAFSLWRLGYRIVLWSVDSRDSFPGSPDGLLEALGASAVRGGDIFLLHDDGEHTVAVLPALIEHILRGRLRIRPLSELSRRARG